MDKIKKHKDIVFSITLIILFLLMFGYIRIFHSRIIGLSPNYVRPPSRNYYFNYYSDYVPEGYTPEQESQIFSIFYFALTLIFYPLIFLDIGLKISNHLKNINYKKLILYIILGILSYQLFIYWFRLQDELFHFKFYMYFYPTLIFELIMLFTNIDIIKNLNSKNN